MKRIIIAALLFALLANAVLVYMLMNGDWKLVALACTPVILTLLLIKVFIFHDGVPTGFRIGAGYSVLAIGLLNTFLGDLSVLQVASGFLLYILILLVLIQIFIALIPFKLFPNQN